MANIWFESIEVEGFDTCGKLVYLNCRILSDLIKPFCKDDFVHKIEYYPNELFLKLFYEDPNFEYEIIVPLIIEGLSKSINLSLWGGLFDVYQTGTHFYKNAWTHAKCDLSLDMPTNLKLWLERNSRQNRIAQIYAADPCGIILSPYCNISIVNNGYSDLRLNLVPFEVTSVKMKSKINHRLSRELSAMAVQSQDEWPFDFNLDFKTAKKMSSEEIKEKINLDVEKYIQFAKSSNKPERTE